MDQQKIDMFLASNAGKLPKEKMFVLQSALAQLDDSKAMLIQTIPFKDPTTNLILSLFFGGYGVDRFMIGQTGLGVLKLLTCGGAGIWAIIDWFLISDLTRQYNYQKLQEALMLQGVTIY